MTAGTTTKKARISKTITPPLSGESFSPPPQKNTAVGTYQHQAARRRYPKGAVAGRCSSESELLQNGARSPVDRTTRRDPLGSSSGYVRAVWPWIEEPDDERTLLEKARVLAATPRTPRTAAEEQTIDPKTAPLHAQRLCVRESPLPPGCNSAAHVGWLGEDMGQVTTIEQARSVVLANAFRDWLWFGTHRTLTDVQFEVFDLLMTHRQVPARAVAVVEAIDGVRRREPTDQHRRTAERSFAGLGGRPGPAPTAELWAQRLAAGRDAGLIAPDGTITWGSRGL